MPDVISLGEVLFDLFAGPPGTTLGAARTFTPAAGGAPANVAVGLARLGIDTGFVGRVGDDSFGGRLLDLLREEGVDTSHCLPAVADGQTTIALVATSSPVDQDFVLLRGADTLLRPEDLDRAYVAGARVFTYGSVTLSAGARDAALQAARWAREAGVLVAFDANYRPGVWPGEEAARDAIVEALRCADIAKLNEVELRLLAGTDDLRAGCRRILDLGVRLCLITLGAGGAWFDDGASGAAFPASTPKWSIRPAAATRSWQRSLPAWWPNRARWTSSTGERSSVWWRRPTRPARGPRRVTARSRPPDPFRNRRVAGRRQLASDILAPECHPCWTSAALRTRTPGL